MDDYAKDTVTGKYLFNASAKVPIAVMVRYLIEWMAYDVNDKFKEIRVPVLVLIPDFKELLTPTSPQDKQKAVQVLPPSNT